jgi:glycosyltransferase involved in cell wall biosynthesis
VNLNTTVVISNYNYDGYVGSAIDSCVAQDVPVKIIVVDDCSTDNSWDVIRDKVDEYSKYPIRAVRLKNNSGGNARGRNIGIKLCDTEYVACLDSDDMLTPDSVRKKQSVLDSNRKVDFVHSFAYVVVNKGSYNYIISNLNSRKIKINPCYTRKKLRGEFSKLSPSSIEWYRGIISGTVLSRVCNYKNLGLYDEELRWKIDREMWRRFIYFGLSRHLVQDRIFIYRRHSRQVTKNRKIKNPKIINNKFKKIVRNKERYGITEDNTVLFKKYNAFDFIEKEYSS